MQIPRQRGFLRAVAGILRSAWGRDGDRYLVYVHRSHVDVLEGFFAGLLRRVIEGRVRDEAPAVLGALRTRLESGDPP